MECVQQQNAEYRKTKHVHCNCRNPLRKSTKPSLFAYNTVLLEEQPAVSVQSLLFHIVMPKTAGTYSQIKNNKRKCRHSLGIEYSRSMA